MSISFHDTAAGILLSLPELPLRPVRWFVKRSHSIKHKILQKKNWKKRKTYHAFGCM